MSSKMAESEARRRLIKLPSKFSIAENNTDTDGRKGYITFNSEKLTKTCILQW